VKMIVDPHLGTQRHIIANRQTAGHPCLGPPANSVSQSSHCD
jgi:hypothetical protein